MHKFMINKLSAGLCSIQNTGKTLLALIVSETNEAIINFHKIIMKNRLYLFWFIFYMFMQSMGFYFDEIARYNNMKLIWELFLQLSQNTIMVSSYTEIDVGRKIVGNETIFRTKNSETEHSIWSFHTVALCKLFSIVP